MEELRALIVAFSQLTLHYCYRLITLPNELRVLLISDTTLPPEATGEVEYETDVDAGQEVQDEEHQQPDSTSMVNGDDDDDDDYGSVDCDNAIPDNEEADHDRDDSDDDDDDDDDNHESVECDKIGIPDNETAAPDEPNPIVVGARVLCLRYCNYSAHYNIK